MKKKLAVTLIAAGCLALVACIVALIVIFAKPELFFGKEKEESISNIKVSTETVDSGQVKNNQAMTYFMGYNDMVISKNGYVPLGNEEINGEDNIYMEYTIYDSKNEEIYKSDLIAPGTELQWKAGDYLVAGEHDLIFHTQPYKIIDVEKDIEYSNLKPLYYIDQNVSLIIME